MSGAQDPNMPASYTPPPRDPTTRDMAIEAARRARRTGASIRRNHLVIATVEGSAATGFNLCLDQSAQIELEERDQSSLRFFLADLRTFVIEAGISNILLRSLPETGKFRTNLGLKIEAALQLVPELEIDLVHFNTVEKWKRYSNGLAPTPIPDLSHWEEEAHRNAIAAACFGEMQAAAQNGLATESNE